MEESEFETMTATKADVDQETYKNVWEQLGQLSILEVRKSRVAVWDRIGDEMAKELKETASHSNRKVVYEEYVMLFLTIAVAVRDYAAQDIPDK